MTKTPELGSPTGLIEPRDLSYKQPQHRVCYMVAATKASGVKEAQSRGWTQIAAFRFATEEKGDVRVISTIRECIPTPGGTRLYRAPDFDTIDPRDHGEFAKLVNSGQAVWLD